MLNYFLKLNSQLKISIIIILISICLLFNLINPSMPGIYVLPVFLATIGIGFRASIASLIISLSISAAIAANSSASLQKVIIQHSVAVVIFSLVIYLGLQIRKYNLDLEKECKRAIGLSRELEVVNEKILFAFVETLEKKDEYLCGHSQNVARFATQVGRQLGWQESEIRELYIAALLHDIGKLAIDGIILNKPSKLNEDEWMQVSEHPAKGASIVRQIPGYENISQMVLYHHQHYNGNGYPFETKGNDIPIGARIIAIADSFDAMISDRSYKRKFSILEAVEEMKCYSGSQFDPKLVDVFIKCIPKFNLVNNPMAGHG